MFKYGNYAFTYNPQSYSKSLELIGDKIITENGRLIIQPTSYRESLSLTSIFYQPINKLKEIVSVNLNSQCIDFLDNTFYIGTSSGKIDKYNQNLVYLSQLSPTLLENNIVGIAVSSTNIYLLCQVGTTNTHYIYVLNHSGIEVTHYTYTSGIASSLAFLDGSLYKQKKDGNIEKIDPANGNVVATYNCIINYITNNLSGSCFYNGYYITVYSNQEIYVVDLTLNKVIDHILIGRTYDPDVQPGVSIIDLVYTSENFPALEINKDKILRLHLNTVSVDIYSLEKEIKKGKLTLTDNNNIDYMVNVNDYNITKLENYFNAYEINLGVNVVA